MPSGVPIVRQTSWLVAIPSLLVVSAGAATGWALGGPNGVIVAGACYLGYSIAARSLVAREHRAGIRMVRLKCFPEAIAHFERSFGFFERHRLLDDWRGLILLSSSRLSYREMALFNQAFCHAQLGEGALAASAYRRCLDLFPDSGMAEAALKMLEAGRSG